MVSPDDSQEDFCVRFAEAVSIMRRLRAPGGCPWDREQTFASIKSHTLEETYEVFDAIEREDWNNLCDELGDLLLQILFYAQMASESGYFQIGDVIAGLNRKLIRRHPHVFGEQASAEAGNANAAELPVRNIGSAQVLRNWETIKQAEKAARKENARSGNRSLLDDIPRSMPALLEARKLGSRARKSGFDWTGIAGVFEKIDEERAELWDAVQDGMEQGAGQDWRQRGAELQPKTRQSIEGELGDLLFTAVNLARHLDVDPEFALRSSNQKFRRRFACMEALAGAPLEELRPAEFEELWTRAKQAGDLAADLAPDLLGPVRDPMAGEL